MKISKRQLKQIIKEEKQKLLKEQSGAYGLADWAEFFMLAATDEPGAMAWLQEYADANGWTLYEAEYHVKEAKEYLRHFGEQFDQNLESDNR
jgi:hypothetical protein